MSEACGDTCGDTCGDDGRLAAGRRTVGAFYTSLGRSRWFHEVGLFFVVRHGGVKGGDLGVSPGEQMNSL